MDCRDTAKLAEVEQIQLPEIDRVSPATSAKISPSSSSSLIKLDELSSFGATKQSRLPTLIKMATQELENQTNIEQLKSMPVCSDEMELQKNEKRRASLPAEKTSENMSKMMDSKNKENLPSINDDIDESFQMVDMEAANDPPLVGPSLPPPREAAKNSILSQLNQSLQGPASNQLGDSLIEMVVNLRNENQSLLQALQTNNDYVKERIEEFKRASDEAKKREAEFAAERADFEHQVRKLKRQNSVLSERLKNMESKLKDMKIEVSDSLAAALSSRASSGNEDFDPGLYPNLADLDPFPSIDKHGDQTMPVETLSIQMDVGNDEIRQDAPSPTAPPLDSQLPAESLKNTTGARVAPLDVSKMTKEELSKHFDANKAAFYAIDDPMKQCDKLEQQLNDMGKRDYEICLLQQQLNIYRQDFRLERMANLEAKIQIEKLKNDIDRLCLERLQDKCAKDEPEMHQDECRHFSTGVKLPPGTSAVLGKFSRKAAKSAAKAAKYAAKQAHLEEKAAAAAAALTARYNARQEQQAQRQQQVPSDSTTAKAQESEAQHSYHGHHRRGSHHHRGHRGVKSEVVSDLWQTANKAMMTGYKMASTHVNLALDKLSEFEQAQANQLAKNKQS